MNPLRRLRERARAGSPPVAAEPPSQRQLEAAARRYRALEAGPRVGYGTVADLADSREHLPWLTGTSFDMKSLQRGWAFKQIVASVEPPGPLLEIGAGEPFVADALARLGYEVTVVDPYDGSGTGPVEYEAFVERFPAVRFVRDQYPSTEAPGEFGAIYSISVLEHLPLEAAPGAAQAAHAQAARNIHAIDHVVLGWGAQEHTERLLALAGGLGLAPAAIEDAVDALDRDPETYLVSAEAHEIWRGPTPYEEYRMRRIASIQLNLGE